MRSQECRKHIQKTGKVCKLSDKTMDEVQRVLEFVEDHSQISDLSTDAAKALMDIPDPMVQQKAISIVGNALNRKTPTGGTIKKRLTKPEVEKAIKKVSPPETVKKESCDVKPSVPEKPSYVGNCQPGEIKLSTAPAQPSLAAQLSGESPPDISDARFGKPAPTPEWSPVVCRAGNCPDGKNHYQRNQARNRLECDFLNVDAPQISKCPIIERQKKAATQESTGFTPASRLDAAKPLVEHPPLKIVPVKVTSEQAGQWLTAIVRGYLTKSSQGTWESIRKTGEMGSTDLEIFQALIDNAGERME